MSIKAWVVMGNDYPAGVFASEAAADEFILFQKWWYQVQSDYQRAHIHWRHYEFTLETEYVPPTLQPGQGKKFEDMMSDDLRREWFYWYRREADNPRAAASAAGEFRRKVETELRARRIDTAAMLDAYRSVAVDPAQRRGPPVSIR